VFIDPEGTFDEEDEEDSGGFVGAVDYEVAPTAEAEIWDLEE